MAPKAAINESAAYDYIVIGSGSAGGGVAARLSENPSVKVLLLEAGPENKTIWAKIPLGFGKIAADPALTWMRTTDPEPALHGRTVQLSGGKIVGGSSAVNGMVYVRGFPLDYALWRQLGADGWSYDEVLPFFKKAERYAKGANEYHGGDGPVGVEGSRWRTKLADAFIASAQELGLPKLEDFAGAKIEGVSYYDLTTWRGQRSSTWASYLSPNRNRQNLHIVTNAFVQKILFDGRQAIGVAYEKDGATIHARAGGEVIVSAGGLRTPQILQLSGVGPGDLLTKHGVPVVHELRGVGENFMDHMGCRRVYTTTSNDSINAVLAGKRSMMLAGANYFLRRSGPLTMGAAVAGAFASTKEGLDAPDVQIAFSPVLIDPETPGGLSKRSGFLLATYPLRPESRGRIQIVAPDPRVDASVLMNALTAENDVTTLIGGLKLLGRIGSGAAFKHFGVTEVTPGLTPDKNDDEELRKFAFETASSAYHYSGTARMGTDALAVVDPSLRVHGVGNLRVIDASVMPTVTSGNTNAASIMIGEKGADLVVKSARQRSAA